MRQFWKESALYKSRKGTKTYGIIREVPEGFGTTRNWQWLTQTGSDRHTSFSRTVGLPIVHLMLVKQHSKRSPAVLAPTVFNFGNNFVLKFSYLTKFFMKRSFVCGFDVFLIKILINSVFYMYTYSVFKLSKLFQGIIIIWKSRLATTFGYRVAILTLENMTQFITHNSSEDC